MKLDENTARAITTLRDNTDFRIFMVALADHGEAVMKKLVFTPDNIHTVQGKAQGITEVLKAIDQAPAQLEAFKARGRANTQV